LSAELISHYLNCINSAISADYSTFDDQFAWNVAGQENGPVNGQFNKFANGQDFIAGERNPMTTDIQSLASANIGSPPALSEPDAHRQRDRISAA
jgi:hypothetical protein